ncbi:transglycosylase SLT domain-containing protein [Pseudomonas aeruginosa]|uniref:transglycosylase SLT domain-containing protein n=1 Tax=Pseudomonas aeruginosa TaxID=287 RepID=UPI00104319F5|nr:transglycosylase SLT domain-containing protein [Pseudomonas aeruginosa]
MTRLLLLSLCLLVLAPLPAAARITGQPDNWHREQPETRDLASIRRAGVLKVLVNQSRNSSGEVKGEPIGVEYRRLRAFEQYLNSRSPSARNLTLKLIPKPKDQLLAALQRGEGDLVAPGELLPAHDGLQVSPSAPVRADVPLVLVARKGNRRYTRVEQASLAVEDVMEMVQAGILGFTVVEQPIAERWAKVLPKLRVDRHLVLDNRADMAWYVRRDASTLRATIDRFLADYRAPADQDVAFQRVYRRAYKVRNPLGAADRKRLEAVRPLLQRYARQSSMDWLALAAVAYKESHLNPKARGSGGASGLMQITPAAARSVGVGNVHDKDSNVLAASRYLTKIRKQFFSSKHLDERERLAFTLAAYNMGPERVQNLRTQARRRGLDPNRWFFQVERVAAEEIGMGVVSYVSSVNKYYLAYERERVRLEPGVRAKTATAQK